MALLDTRYLATKAKFSAVNAYALSMPASAGGPCSPPTTQEAGYDSAHATLQSKAQSYSDTFIQKNGLNAAGFSLIDSSITTGASMPTILSDTCSIMKNITDGNIYDAIDSTLDLMLLSSDCTTLTSFLPILDINNQGILTALDIYAVADEIETAIQNFVSQYGFVVSIFSTGTLFYDTMKCCLDQVSFVDPNFGLVKITLDNAFNSLIAGTDVGLIMQNIKNDVASMVNLPNTLSSLYTRITNNSLYGPRTC